MIEYEIWVYQPEVRMSFIYPGLVEAKNAKQAFNKAVKLLHGIHTSRIRVERKNDRTQA